MTLFETTFQLGKNGITVNFISSLDSAFKTHRQIRISALKSSGRDKESIKATDKEIVSKLKTNAIFKVIGFTIILRRVRAETPKK